VAETAALESPGASATDLIYGLEDKPPLRETIFVALQHVFAVFVGIITPPLIICNALKLDRPNTVFLVSMSLFISGLATLLQSRGIGPIGSRLLSIQGTSFVFLGPIISTAGLSLSAGPSPQHALGIIFGLCLAGSSVAILISQCVRLASRIITPLVTGTVVTLIGLTLIEVGITTMGGGFDAKRDGSFGSPLNLALSGMVLATIVILNCSRMPQLRMMSVVLGLALGYLAAFLLGKVDLRGLRGLPLISIPVPLHYGLGFNAGAFIPFAFLYLITVIESIGDLTATSSLTNQPITGDLYFRRLRSGILADGINSLLAAIFNSFPSTTFAQNNGVIQLTGVGSRYVGTFIAVILMALGLFPAVGGLVQALPQAVLGGATIVMFGTVAIAGIRILAGVRMNRRCSLIIAVSIGLGLGVTFVPDILRSVPEFLRHTLSSGIATGGMCALLLNSVLPGERS
jgi:xanthine permease XanP